jgi:hypothetical protein
MDDSAKRRADGPGADPAGTEAVEGAVAEEGQGRELAIPGDLLPVDLPIVPLFGRPMFPVQSLPERMRRPTITLTHQVVPG